MKILICGDFAPRYSIEHAIINNNMDNVFNEILPYTADADYSIVNLEAPISETDENKITKSGPTLNAPTKTIDVVKSMGFDCVTLANNHFMDQGTPGAESTITLCKENDIDYVGAGVNIDEARRVLYKRINNITLGIYSICEQEFSIATETSAGCAPVNPIINYNDIKQAKEQCDFLIVIVHGGTEFYPLPTPRMKETYRFYIDIGADVVINHHQHCYSGYEIYKEKPIFYGIGNFIFDNNGKKDKSWETGYMVKLEITKDSPIKFNLIPYTQTKNQIPYLQIIRDQTEFNKSIEELNFIIEDDKKLKKEFDIMASSKTFIFESIMLPDIPFVKSLYFRGFIPALSKRQRTILLNLIRCESHRDVFMNILKSGKK